MNKLITTLIASLIMSISVISADDQPDLEALRSHAAAGDSNAQLDLAIRYRDG
jgi:hypothetical protein